MRLALRISYSVAASRLTGKARTARLRAGVWDGAPPERSGAIGAAASDGDGGSGGAKPPGSYPPERSGAIGAAASDGDGGSGGAKPPGS